MTILERLQSAAKAFYKPVVPVTQKASAWENIFLRCIEDTYLSDKVTEPYKQYEWVYVAIREIAVAVSQVPLIFTRGEAEVETHEMKYLLDRPNPYMNAYQMKEAIITHLCMDGDAFLVPWRANGGNAGRIDQLWVFGKSKMKCKVGDNGQIERWELQAGKTPVFFDPREVVHFKLFNPYDYVWGLSPVSVARIAMETDYSAQKYTQSMLANNAEPSGVVTVDAPITPEQVKVLRMQWEERHKGSKQAGKVAILQKGMDYKGISMTQRDMEFLRLRQYNREAILAIFQIPKGVVGITDDLNYATLFGQKRIFWQDTIMPYLRLIEEGINAGLMRYYAPDIEVSFDTSSVAELHEDYTQKVDSAVKLAQIGFPINAINEKLELGFDPVPWGDVAYISNMMVPIDMFSLPEPDNGNGNEPAEEDEDELEEAPKAISAAIRIVDREKDRMNMWMQSVRRMEPIEARFRKKMQRFFWEQRAAILELLLKNTKDVGDVRAYLWDEQKKKLVKMTEPLYRDAVLAGTFEMVSVIGDLATDVWTLQNPLVVSAVQNRVDKIGGLLNETMRKRIIGQIETGLRTGETINQVADRIRSEYDMAKHRAITIARTETAGAYGDGEMLVMEREGVEKKEWLSARDQWVRESHRQEDGNVVDIHDPFPVTGLFRPGDPSGPPEEVINCRCVLNPIVD